MVDSETTPLPSVMAFYFPKDKATRRKRAAQLLEAVLDEQIAPRLAINRWPMDPAEADPDPSLVCACHALWYFEADEDLQHRELFYIDAQMDLLRRMASLLAKNEAFPDDILQLYAGEPPIRFFQPSAPWWEASWLVRDLGGAFWRAIHACRAWIKLCKTACGRHSPR